MPGRPHAAIKIPGDLPGHLPDQMPAPAALVAEGTVLQLLLCLVISGAVQDARKATCCDQDPGGSPWPPSRSDAGAGRAGRRMDRAAAAPRLLEISGAVQAAMRMPCSDRDPGIDPRSTFPIRRRQRPNWSPGGPCCSCSSWRSQELPRLP